MKKLSFFLSILVFLFSSSILYSSEYESKIKQLDIYLKEGLISQSDYYEARKTLLKLKEIKIEREKAKSAKAKNLKKKFELRKFKKQVKGTKEFEKMELVFSDFRIYTHRPGGIKIKRLSDNKQLAVVGDKFKIKHYNNSENLINFKKLSDTKAVLKVKNIPVLTWDFKDVKKHKAGFYQVLALGTKPFHYYINLYGKNRTIALNYSNFDRQIDKAVDKAKVRLASTYNVSIAQIDSLMKKREEDTLNELQKLIGEKKDQVLQASIEDAVEDELAKQLEAALGAALANEFNAALEKEFGVALDQAVENELASAIDDAIAEAISMGISEAAISAGIAAALAVLAAGGTEEEAIAAGEEACGC